MFRFWSIFCITKLTNNTNNNLLSQVYNYQWNSTRQLLFAHADFLSLSKISVVFSSSHSSTNLPISRFLQEQFLVSNYSSIFHALLHSQSRVLGFHIKPFSQDLQSFILVWITYTFIQ